MNMSKIITPIIITPKSIFLFVFIVRHQIRQDIAMNCQLSPLST